MVVQDPVVIFGPEVMKNNPYDSNIYKLYTREGTRVSFTVWLPLLLHEGGPLLSKGVVEPFKEVSWKIKRNKDNDPQEKTEETVDYCNRFHPTFKSTPSAAGSKPGSDYTQTRVNPVTDEFRQEVTQTTASGYPLKYTIVYCSNNKPCVEFGGKLYDLLNFKNHFGLQ